jgi:hypothetical protein
MGTDGGFDMVRSDPCCIINNRKTFSITSSKSAYGAWSSVCYTRFVFDYYKDKYSMINFTEYVALREGGWLPDKNALPGYSRVTVLPRKMKKPSSLNIPKPPPIRSIVPNQVLKLKQ